MKFREISAGVLFEFDHSGLPLCHGLETGPWIKTGARTYEPASVLHRLSGHTLHVGSINAKVVLGQKMPEA